MPKSFIFILSLIVFTSVSAQNCDKFGIVNIDEIVSMLPDTKYAQEQLNELQKQQQILITDREQKVQEMIEEYKNGGYDNKDSLQEYESALREMKQSIWVLTQNTQNLLIKMEESLYLPIIEKVNTAIRKVAEHNHICLVFENSFDEALPYYSESINITKQVKKELSLE